jgi:hypothetical protein
VRRLLAATSLALTLALGACSSDTAPALTTTPSTVATAPAVATPTPAAATATARPSTLEPYGFPIAPNTPLGAIVGRVPNRRFEAIGGPTAFFYSRDDQISSDPAIANRSGWDCRVHQEYEGQPAVDWYLAADTPVVATMSGTAHLFVITTSNAFDFYGVSREPYLANPDRSRAPLSPFPGPGGGKGIFVRIENDAFATEYAHLQVETMSLLPPSAFLPGYSATTDYASQFKAMRDFQTFTEVARWQVRTGDVIGRSGDTGYSEAPHLHYTVRRQGGALLCPTRESGFEDGGWLFRP